MGITRYSILILLIFSQTIAAQPPTVKREYKIALVLPFHSNATGNPLTEVMLDYYEGFKMGVRNLESEGLNLKLYVFDCEKDSESLHTIFRHPDMKKMDVIIGPIYNNNLNYAETFCNKHNILLVSPLKFYQAKEKKSRILNFFVPDSLRCISIAEKTVQFFPGFKYVIVNDNSTESQAQAVFIKQRIYEITHKMPRTIIYSSGKLASSVYGDSTILISTVVSKEAKPVLEKAIKYMAHSYIMAQMNWHNSSQSTFEIDEPRIIYPEVNFVSHSDTDATQFRNRFFEDYYGEPSKYAFIGYDQASFIGYNLLAFGETFDENIPDAEYRGLIGVLRLKKSERGFVNLGLNFIQIIEEERREFSP